MNEFYEEVVIAGFGGQGIILASKLLAHSAMNTGREVTLMPSYGAEVRGGTSNCTVIVSDTAVASPLADSPTSLVIMNKASLDKFGPRIRENGLLVLNSSLIDSAADFGKDLRLVRVPADDIACELGNPKTANMVILGAYLEKSGLLSWKDAAETLQQVLSRRYHKLIPLNTEAMKLGAEFISNGQ